MGFTGNRSLRTDQNFFIGLYKYPGDFKAVVVPIDGIPAISTESGMEGTG